MSTFDELAGPTRGAQQDPSTAISGLAESVVGPLIRASLQNPAQPLFPKLSQAFAGLFNSINAGQQFSCQTRPLPFSPAALGISPALFNNPGQLQGLLANASQKLSRATGRDSQETAASGGPQGEQAAQKVLQKLGITLDQASTLMNIHSHR